MTFKPSDLRIETPIPFLDTFENVETELAAACLARALAVTGDTWRGLQWRELADAMLADPGPLAPIMKVPMARPNYHKLVDGGFARWEGGEDVKTLAFTTAGIKRLAKWARRSS